MLLFIDTSSDTTTIALAKDGQPIDFYKWNLGQRLSEELLPKIDGLLRKNRLSLKELSGIAVVKGPGSYTGLRVGIAVANSLAFSLGVKIVGLKALKPSPLQKQLKKGVELLKKAKKGNFVIPAYSYPPKITQSKNKGLPRLWRGGRQAF